MGELGSARLEVVSDPLPPLPPVLAFLCVEGRLACEVVEDDCERSGIVRNR
jgi:hypothetical protein